MEKDRAYLFPMPNKSSLRLRLQRWGRLHRPFYRIVACNCYAPRDGKFHEVLGTYDPIPDKLGNKQVSLKIDRIKHWMCAGAEPSERVAKLLGIAEVLPPPPRRSLAKAIREPLDDDFDGASEDDGEPATGQSSEASEAPAGVQ